MKLSTKARYTLRAMIDLAIHYDQNPVPRKDIARRQEVSAHYLEQLFTKMKEAGLIKAVRGPGGGYLLTQRPEDIKVAAVIEAVEEILGPVPCIRAESPLDCHRAPTCVTRLLWSEIGQRTYDFLDSITLQDMCERSRELAA